MVKSTLVCYIIPKWIYLITINSRIRTPKKEMQSIWHIQIAILIDECHLLYVSAAPFFILLSSYHYGKFLCFKNFFLQANHFIKFAELFEVFYATFYLFCLVGFNHFMPTDIYNCIS